MRGDAFAPHLLRGQRHLELNGKSAMVLIILVIEVRQGFRIAGRTRRHRLAERRERLWAYDPRTDTRQEILGQKRAERLIFPSLDITRGPIVEKTVARDVLRSLSDRNGRTQFVSFPNPDPELQFVIQPTGRAELWSIRIGSFALTIGANYRLPGNSHRARPAMVSDRHIFVVGEQRIVGTELL